jgi:hypothetical protein
VLTRMYLRAGTADVSDICDVTKSIENENKYIHIYTYSLSDSGLENRFLVVNCVGLNHDVVAVLSSSSPHPITSLHRRCVSATKKVRVRQKIWSCSSSIDWVLDARVSALVIKNSADNGI